MHLLLAQRTQIRRALAEISRKSTWLRTWGQGEHSSSWEASKDHQKQEKEEQILPLLTGGLTLRLLGVKVNLPATGGEEPEENLIASE